MAISSPSTRLRSARSMPHWVVSTNTNVIYNFSQNIQNVEHRTTHATVIQHAEAL
jgi:hypothetical protein